MHGEPVNVPVVLVQVTEPVGVDTVPAAISVTVAMQVALCPADNVAGLHVTVVLVVRRLTVTLAAVVLLLTA